MAKDKKEKKVSFDIGPSPSLDESLSEYGASATKPSTPSDMGSSFHDIAAPPPPLDVPNPSIQDTLEIEWIHRAEMQKLFRKNPKFYGSGTPASTSVPSSTAPSPRARSRRGSQSGTAPTGLGISGATDSPALPPQRSRSRARTPAPKPPLESISENRQPPAIPDRFSSLQARRPQQEADAASLPSRTLRDGAPQPPKRRSSKDGQDSRRFGR